ncbi:HlyD family secretion protein [Mariniphaga anaerophila]|nr:HlyD family efflux transporter periplasmic adaptor subunit [Mariniphaga anaerophila]
MKYKILIATLSTVLFGCTNNNDQSDAYGNFETETTIVAAESSGKIIQKNVEKGQKIEAGFIAVITDTVQPFLKLKQIEAQKAAVVSKRASVAAQIAVFEEQKRNLQINEKRISQMLSDGAATQKQLDDITGQINVANRQIESTKTQFSSISKELEVVETQKEATGDLLRRCTVKSPASGTILETYAELGELATPGKPLFKMANLDELTLKVYVSGAQLSNIKIGQEVSVWVDKNETDNQSFPGKITWISSEAEFTPKIIQTKEERVKLVYAVKVAVKNNGTLKIGMPGEISWQ